ncbi:TRAP transporter substrate-binding protein [Herbaspirillum autotrophicum]|uniref:TRAP transporter substrate-binding protein n=1 Tax=Herbaspirillum autotrophicum TaxID=180195 RepID=UPI00067DD33E|nr:TRAP transporter substrate-binding protein [Herbaspirillum autotrophicum]
MKKLFPCVSALLAALTFGLAAQAVAQAPVKLTLGHNAAPGNPKAEGTLKFAELVKAKSNGRITVQVAGAAQLGEDLTMISALRTGTLDMSANSQGPVSSVVPELAALGMPFLFASLPQAWALLDGPVGQDLAKRFEAKNMVLIAWFDNGIRQTTNSKHPIAKPDDLKGLKIRTPADPVTVDTFQAMGASTQQINFSELYIALQQGVVDGQENPLANIHSSKLHEVQKYISMTNHKYESTPVLMSAITWKRLSDPDRKIIREAAAEATLFQRKLMADSDEKLLAEYKKNPAVQVNSPDLAPFKAVTKVVWNDWEKKPFGDFVKKLRATIQ